MIIITWPEGPCHHCHGAPGYHLAMRVQEITWPWRTLLSLGYKGPGYHFPATNEAHASGKSPSFKYTWNVLQIYLQIIRPASSEVLQTSMIHNNHTSNEAPGTSSILFLTHTCFSRSPGNFCWKCQGLCWCFVNINK